MALPSYFAGKPVEFSYYLEGGKQEKWSDWSTDYKKELSNLHEGAYTFHLRARNQFMHQTSETEFFFSYLCPIGTTKVFGGLPLSYAFYVGTDNFRG